MGITLGPIGFGEVGSICGRLMRKQGGVDAVAAWDLRSSEPKNARGAQTDGVGPMGGLAELRARGSADPTVAACSMVGVPQKAARHARACIRYLDLNEAAPGPKTQATTTVPRRRLLLGGLAAMLLGGCAAPSAPPREQAVLAPTGTLRVGVYLGSPTSLVVDAQGRRAGVALEMGQRLGQWLGVPVQAVEYPRVAEVVEAIRAGQIDFTVTNASPARAQLVDFSAPLIDLELGYLVPGGSRVEGIAGIDQAGMRVGVSQGSSSQAALRRQFRQAQILPQPSLQQAAAQLRDGQLDAFATNKAILYELADQVPGARVLAGRWGLEHMAMAIPKGRQAALPALLAFAATVRADGTLAAIVGRAGLRGTATL